MRWWSRMVALVMTSPMCKPTQAEAWRAEGLAVLVSECLVGVGDGAVLTRAVPSCALDRRQGPYRRPEDVAPTR